MDDQENWNHFLSLQDEFDLPEDFFKNLYFEDDWSFIIKTHALIESLSSSLILYHFKQPEISTLISRLEMSNPQTGKIAFLKSLKLLDDVDRKYITALSALRNNLVHKVENTSFTFSNWVKKMSNNQLKVAALNFSPYDSFVVKLNKKAEKRKKEGTPYIELDQPNLQKIYRSFQICTKDHIWYGLHHLLTNISDAKGYSDYLQEKRYSEFIYDFD